MFLKIFFLSLNIKKGEEKGVPCKPNSVPPAAAGGGNHLSGLSVATEI